MRQYPAGAFSLHVWSYALLEIRYWLPAVR